MKLTKKKVLVAAIAICLIATLSMGTLAWFSATDSITNKFPIADSLTSFEIDVWEIVPDGSDEDDQPDVVGRGKNGETSYEYAAGVTPGATFDKKVYVENTSGNTLTGQYVKVELTFTNYSVLNAMRDNSATVLDCCETMLTGANFDTKNDDAQDGKAWYYAKNETVYVDRVENDPTSDTITYTFYLKTVLENSDGVDDNDINDPVRLFDGVQIPNSMDINDVEYLKAVNGFEIKVVAYAIQNVNIEDPNGDTTLDDAMYAFGTPWEHRNDQPTLPEIPDINPPATT